MTYGHAPMLQTPCLACGAPGVFVAEDRPGMLCGPCGLHALAKRP